MIEAVGLGIDIGGDQIHCVELAENGRIERMAVVAPHALDELAVWAAGVSVVAIDAP